MAVSQERDIARVTREREDTYASNDRGDMQALHQGIEAPEARTQQLHGTNDVQQRVDVRLPNKQQQNVGTTVPHLGTGIPSGTTPPPATQGRATGSPPQDHERGPQSIPNQRDGGVPPGDETNSPSGEPRDNNHKNEDIFKIKDDILAPRKWSGTVSAESHDSDDAISAQQREITGERQAPVVTSSVSKSQAELITRKRVLSTLALQIATMPRPRNHHARLKPTDGPREIHP